MSDSNSINKEVVQAYIANPAYKPSQAGIGRALRFAGYRFANSQFRKLWDEIHGVVRDNGSAQDHVTTA